jgi:hypothetical protein
MGIMIFLRNHSNILMILSFGTFGSMLAELISLKRLLSVTKDVRPSLRDKLYLSLPIDIIVGLGFVLAYYFTDKGLAHNPILIIHISAASPMLAKLIAFKPD